jgi:hypothetical protein
MWANVGVVGRDPRLRYAVSLDQFVRHVWRTVCAPGFESRFVVCTNSLGTLRRASATCYRSSTQIGQHPRPSAPMGSMPVWNCGSTTLSTRRLGCCRPRGNMSDNCLRSGAGCQQKQMRTSWCIAMQACRGRRPRWRCSWHRPCLNALGQTSSGRSCAFGPKFSPTFA